MQGYLCLCRGYTYPQNCPLEKQHIFVIVSNKQTNKKNKTINYFIVQVDLDSHWLCFFFLFILFVAHNQEKLGLAIPHDVLFGSDLIKSHLILLLGQGCSQEDLQAAKDLFSAFCVGWWGLTEQNQK